MNRFIVFDPQVPYDAGKVGNPLNCSLVDPVKADPVTAPWATWGGTGGGSNARQYIRALDTVQPVFLAAWDRNEGMHPEVQLIHIPLDRWQPGSLNPPETEEAIEKASKKKPEEARKTEKAEAKKSEEAKKAEEAEAKKEKEAKKAEEAEAKKGEEAKKTRNSTAKEGGKAKSEAGGKLSWGIDLVMVLCAVYAIVF